MDEIRDTFEVNVFGHLAMTQSLLPMLRETRGRLVFTSSVSGRVAMPFLGTYAATKYALEAYADALRREVQPFGVRVSLIEPGSIDTGIWDKGLDPAVRARLDPQAEALYAPGLDMVEKEARRAAKAATSVDAVVKAVDHAVTSRRPKRRYQVGRDATVIIPLATHAPALIDAVVARNVRRG